MSTDFATITKEIAPILYEHIEMANNMGFFKYNEMPYVEELDDEASKVCKQIHDGISNYYSEEEPDKTIYDNIPTFMDFCAYAGMGAVAFWYNDNKTIKEHGIYETLTKERGIFEMDEFVFDYLGIGYGSDRQQEISHNFKCIIDSVVTKFTNLMPKDSTQSNFSTYFRLIMEASKVVYKLGMIYQMQEMGHREEECTSFNMLVNMSDRQSYIEANTSYRQRLVKRLKDMIAADMSKEEKPPKQQGKDIWVCFPRVKDISLRCDKCGSTFTRHRLQIYSNEELVAEIQSLGLDCMLHHYCSSCAKDAGYDDDDCDVFLSRFENSEPYRKAPIIISGLKALCTFLKNENCWIDVFEGENYIGKHPDIIERMIGISRYE